MFCSFSWTKFIILVFFFFLSEKACRYKKYFARWRNVSAHNNPVSPSAAPKSRPHNATPKFHADLILNVWGRNGCYGIRLIRQCFGFAGQCCPWAFQYRWAWVWNSYEQWLLRPCGYCASWRPSPITLWTSLYQKVTLRYGLAQASDFLLFDTKSSFQVSFESQKNWCHISSSLPYDLCHFQPDLLALLPVGQKQESPIKNVDSLPLPHTVTSWTVKPIKATSHCTAKQISLLCTPITWNSNKEFLF